MDSIEELGEEIATLAAHIHAATHRFLLLIAEFDRLRGWEPSGQRDCAHWLAFRTGLDVSTAQAKVRAARALTRLPRISATMSKGERSYVDRPASPVHARSGVWRGPRTRHRRTGPARGWPGRRGPFAGRRPQLAHGGPPLLVGDRLREAERDVDRRTRRSDRACPAALSGPYTASACTPRTDRPEGSAVDVNAASHAIASGVLHAIEGPPGTHAAHEGSGKKPSKMER